MTLERDKINKNNSLMAETSTKKNIKKSKWGQTKQALKRLEEKLHRALTKGKLGLYALIRCKIMSTDRQSE